VGEELLKEDVSATAKLREELAEATLSLNIARDEIALLKAENETCKGEVVGLKKVVDTLKVENDSLQQRCLAAEEKEKAVVRRVEALGEDVVDLDQRMTQLTLKWEEEKLLRTKAEKDFREVQAALMQHDIGFERTVRQAAFFYQVPIDEGRFDNRKDIYQGELTAIMDIPDEEKEVEAHNGTSKVGGGFSALDIIVFD